MLICVNSVPFHARNLEAFVLRLDDYEELMMKRILPTVLIAMTLFSPCTGRSQISNPETR